MSNYEPYLFQCRSHQVLSGQVCSACVSTLQLGGSGGMLPRKFWEFRGYEIASETIFRSIQCFSEARRQSFTTTVFAHFRDHSLISKATPFAHEACETIIVHLEERKVVGRKTQRSFSHCSQPSRKFQHVAYVLGALHGHPPSAIRVGACNNVHADICTKCISCYSVRFACPLSTLNTFSV